MTFKTYTALCLSTLALFTCYQLEADAQSTVLTGRVERSAARPGASVNLKPQLSNPALSAPNRDVSASRAVAVSRAAQQGAVQTVIVERPVYRTVYLKDNRSYWQRHPKVKAATIGAGVGAGAGAVTGLIAGRSVVRGAAIGAGTGAGVGLVRSSNTMKRHPIVKDTSTGALVGLGIGAASGRRGATLKGAGVGAAVGLGASLLKNGLD